MSLEKRDMQDIKSLLVGSLQRHQITTQVTTARIIEVVNNEILAVFPSGHAHEAIAISVRDGMVNVLCKNAGAAHLLSQEEQRVIDSVKKVLPSVRLDRIRTRIGV